MPIEKFRSAEEMQAAPAVVSTATFDRFLRHCARFRKLSPRNHPRGVFKFRSIDEAQSARQQVALARRGDQEPGETP